MEAPRAVARDAGLLERLDNLEARVSHLRVPKVHAPLVYVLRQHIRLVRERLERRPAP